MLWKLFGGNCGWVHMLWRPHWQLLKRRPPFLNKISYSLTEVWNMGWFLRDILPLRQGMNCRLIMEMFTGFMMKRWIVFFMIWTAVMGLIFCTGRIQPAFLKNHSHGFHAIAKFLIMVSSHQNDIFPWTFYPSKHLVTVWPSVNIFSKGEGWNIRRKSVFVCEYQYDQVWEF